MKKSIKHVQTVFLVNGETYAIDGSGQQAAQTVLDSFPGQVVKLHGFIIDGEFKNADISSHWSRTIALKNK